MSSRRQAAQKPYWKRQQKQVPGYVREYAYDENGLKVLSDDGEHQYRERPNRGLVRRIAAMIRRTKQ